MVGAQKFGGDLSTLWRLDSLKPLHRLSWWWWWWLLIFPHPTDPSINRQLMVLWSTKDTPSITVNDTEWKGGERPATDESGGLVLNGMVAAWWFDGEAMHEPLVLTKERIAVIPAGHPLWPSEVDGGLVGGGGVIPLGESDLSMGLQGDLTSFWLNLEVPSTKGDECAPKQFRFNIKPWTKQLSDAVYSHEEYGGGMGYDILRIHGAKVLGEVDGEVLDGTGYFQKVTVQAPSPPWFWGMLHFSDGSYLDWFLPHFSPAITLRDSSPWPKRDTFHIPLSRGGLFHDGQDGTTHQMSELELLEAPSDKPCKIPSDTEGADGAPPPLPVHLVRMKGDGIEVVAQVTGLSRAHWSFDQATIAGLVSHLTYNEYPVRVDSIKVVNNGRTRQLSDWNWIRGNIEHSWGFLY